MQGKSQNEGAVPPLPAAQMQDLEAAVEDLRATLETCGDKGDEARAGLQPGATLYRPFFSETRDAFHTTGQDEPHSMLGGASLTVL